MATVLACAFFGGLSLKHAQSLAGNQYLQFTFIELVKNYMISDVAQRILENVHLSNL